MPLTLTVAVYKNKLDNVKKTTPSFCCIKIISFYYVRIMLTSKVRCKIKCIGSVIHHLQIKSVLSIFNLIKKLPYLSILSVQSCNLTRQHYDNFYTSVLFVSWIFSGRSRGTRSELLPLRSEGYSHRLLLHVSCHYHARHCSGIRARCKYPV